MTQKVEVIDKKEFAAAILNKKDKIFVMLMTAFNLALNIHPSQEVKIVLLDVEKVTISSKYTDYTNVFSLDSAAKLAKHIGINNHLMNLINDKQPPYGLINSLELVELKMLKTYIENNLANGFIRSFKSPTGDLILFICKKNNNFQLYIDYWGLNNLTIKNWYLLPLISKSLNYLGYAKHFTQLDLTNVYH